jgi:hypothetical protein
MVTLKSKEPNEAKVICQLKVLRALEFYRLASSCAGMIPVEHADSEMTIQRNHICEQNWPWVPYSCGLCDLKENVGINYHHYPN